MNALDLPLTLTIPEVAEILRVNIHKAYDIAREPDFPVIKRGKRLIVPRDSFLRWMETEAVRGG